MLKILPILLLLVNSINCIKQNNPNPKQELKNYILENQYHTTIPNNKGTVNVSLGIALRAFDNIDHIDGSINMNVWLRYKWEDKNYNWDPKKWYNITNIKLNSNPELEHYIWTPDIYLYNTAEKPLSELDYTNIVLNYDGSIFWSRPGLIKSTCTFDLTYFPYDKQLCYLKFGSWSYDSSEIFLIEDIIDITNLQKHEEWKLGKYYSVKNLQKYSCCKNTYEDIQFFYEIIRKPEYYNINIVIPTFSTASLMILTLFVPWDSGERISFAVTILLSIIVFLLILSDNLPKTDKYPLLSKMIIGLVYFSLIGVVFTVFINALKSYMDKKDYEKKSNKNTIFTNFISCFSCNNDQTNSVQCPETGQRIQRTQSYLDIVNADRLKKCCKNFIRIVESIYITLFTLGFIIYCSIIFLKKENN